MFALLYIAKIHTIIIKRITTSHNLISIIILTISNTSIIFREVIPNCLAPIIVQATLSVASAILSTASLSFIGLGVQPPAPEWGAMLSSGRSYLRDAMHLTLFPGLAIIVTILALNLLGDGLRDALDPKLKQ